MDPFHRQVLKDCSALHPHAALTWERSLQKHPQDDHMLYLGRDPALMEVAILVPEGYIFVYGQETDSEFPCLCLQSPVFVQIPPRP